MQVVYLVGSSCVQPRGRTCCGMVFGWKLFTDCSRLRSGRPRLLIARSIDRCPELLERKKRNRQVLGGGDDPAVVARQPDVLAMASQKLDRSQVQGVQRPERDRPRLKRW